MSENAELRDQGIEGSRDRVEGMEDAPPDPSVGPALESAKAELEPEAGDVPTTVEGESAIDDRKPQIPEPQPLIPGPEPLVREPESLDAGTPEPAPPEPDSPIHGPESPAPSPSSPSAPPLDPNQVIEALLFAADAPVKLDRLAELAAVPPETVRAVIDQLNANYQETGRTFRVQRVAQGFQLYTMPDYAEFVRRLYQHQYTHRLSRAALEVLAIVAYKQPVTRPEVDQLRGVDCSGPLVTLLERRLIATYGRASRPGNPFLYRTTPEFLRYFGLAGLEDLPRMEEIGEFLARRETGPDAGEPDKGETFDSLAMDGGHKDAAPEDAR